MIPVETLPTVGRKTSTHIPFVAFDTEHPAFLINSHSAGDRSLIPALNGIYSCYIVQSRLISHACCKRSFVLASRSIVWQTVGIDAKDSHSVRLIGASLLSR